MKRLWPCLLFLFNSEILSCIALLIYVAMFLHFLLRAAAEREAR